MSTTTANNSGSTGSSSSAASPFAVAPEIAADAPAGVQFGADLARYHTLGLRCRAWAFAEATSPAHLAGLLAWATRHDKRARLIGGGSNLLFTTTLVDALIVRFGRDLAYARVEPERCVIVCGAAATWRPAIKAARDAGFGGLEYGWCIPGTIGGALAGNAGAAQRAVCEDAVRVRVMDPNGDVQELASGEFTYDYRRSALRDHVVVEAELGLEVTPPDIVDQRLAAMRDMRKTQPTGVHSSGCFFKNPPGGCAGRIIEECGLKGRAVGDAAVSDVHANFLINRGNATPEDLLALMRTVQDVVRERTGIALEPEVRMI